MFACVSGENDDGGGKNLLIDLIGIRVRADINARLRIWLLLAVEERAKQPLSVVAPIAVFPCLELRMAGYDGKL